MVAPKQTLQKAETQPAKRVFSPRADIYEKDDVIVVVADLPGVEDKSLDITLEKNRLNIRGSTEPGDSNGYSLAHREYRDGDYERSFILSDKVEGEKIEAVLKNGVLELKLPKIKEAAARKIQVKAD